MAPAQGAGELLTSPLPTRFLDRGSHLAELDSAARQRLETVSLHINQRERDPAMETLDLDDRKAWAESMLQLGDWLARDVPWRFAVPPAL